MNASIAVPSGGDLFEGHFPGRPILPGVAQLAMILDASVSQIHDSSGLSAIAHMRMRQLVLPGDQLELTTRELDGGRLRFDLKRAAVVVANGELVFRLLDALEWVPSPESFPVHKTGPARMSAPPLDALIPHRPPMRFVTALLDETQDGLICEAHIPAACALVRDDGVRALVALEAAAQSAAAWEGLQRRREGGAVAPRVGYLVALRDVALFADRIRADEPLICSVQQESAALPLSYYRVAVSSKGNPILRGTIVTFLTDSEGAEKLERVGG
jgi:3-hydroxyacyl-[acyl-carrier-protein] dehydratase